MRTRSLTRLPVSIVLLLLLGEACSEGPTERRSCGAADPCPGDQLCQDGVCVDPPPDSALKADGEPCGAASQCKGKLCLVAGAASICATACDEPGTCAEGSGCLVAESDQATFAGDAADGGSGAAAPAIRQLLLACLPAEGLGAAFVGEACDGDGACRDGICHDGRCTRACTADSCPSGWACEEATLEREGVAPLSHGVCRREPPLRIVELGAVDTPVSGGEPLTFEVSADDPRAFVVVAEGPEDRVISIARLEGPDGSVLVDMTKPKETLIRSGVYHGTAAVAVPGSDDPAAAVKPGTYKVWPQTYEARYDKLVPVAGKIDRVAAVFRRWGSRGGLIDLNMHFAPGTGITAATAPNDAVVKEGLAALDALFRRMIGVAVGEVSYFDLPPEDDVVADGDHVRRIRKKHSRPGPHGLSVGIFIVKKLTLAKGLAGGIPGAPGVTGRAASGIVVERDGTPARMGKLLAHEIGHYLGLWHPTETEANEIARYDTITDTPFCPSGTAVEECPDFTNLMFPYYLNAPDPLALSPGQATVVRSSPWLYQQVSFPDACGGGVAAVDLSLGFASGQTALDGADGRSGSCGGEGHPEVAHLRRLPFGAQKLQVDVVGDGFVPVVYVLRGDCQSAEAEEVACAVGDDKGQATAEIEAPTAGDYLIFVDGVDGGGDYSLTVNVTK